MFLDYEPIREGVRYVRRWLWHCWCVEGVKQRFVQVLQPDGTMHRRWINVFTLGLLLLALRKLHLIRPDLIPYPLMIEVYA